MNTIKMTVFRLLATCAAICFSTEVSAQQASAPAAGQPDQAETPDIVVTAQARSERLQEVPIQVTALTAQRIEDAGVKSTADALTQVANVTFDQGNSYRSAFITMRGLTQINNADPPVAFVLDGVPQTNQETVGINLFDIERIEILKGPQGSLYGRNAEGGAINIITRQPTNRFEGFGNISYASGNDVRASAGVSGPIVADTVLFRATGSYRQADGLVSNSFSNHKVDYIDHDWSTRGQLIITPISALKIDLRGQYNDFSGGSTYYSTVFSGNPNDFVNPQGNFPSFSQGYVADLTGKIDYDFGFATLTSITGYTSLKQTLRADVDFRNPVQSPTGIFGLGFQAGQGQDLRLKTFSQELRLVSASEGPFRWLIGAYYLHTDRDLRNRAFVDLNGDPNQVDNAALVFADQNGSQRNKAYAVFGQADYDILPNLTITGGLRYDDDHRRQQDLSTLAVRSASFDKIQPKATLTWKVTPNQLVYATFSTGFRSGGFNGPTAIAPLFKAESLRNYELGFKAQFLGRLLTINGALFQSDVDNYQYFFVDAATASQIISNIDRVRIRGGELELIAIPLKGLEASVGIGVTDTNIRRSAFLADIGNHTPRTVPFSSTASIQYRGGVSESVTGLIRVEWQHFGRKYWDADNVSVQNPYNLVNVRAGLEWKRISVTAFVKNLTGDRYYSEYFRPKYTGLDVAFGYPGVPRSYGIESRIKF
jgi:iron complex outermembrane receptor protein